MTILEYAVWCPEYGQTESDARTFRAYDQASAVEYWAEWFDGRGDYPIVGGSDAEVCVRVPGVAEVSTFVVTGESVPRYYATRTGTGP